MIIHLLEIKQALDTLWFLSEHGQHRQEVAVTQFALNNVTRRDRVLEDRELTFLIIELLDFCGADPLDLAPCFNFLLNLFSLIIPILNQ